MEYNNKNPRTLRSKKRRLYLYQAYSGKCAECGKELPHNWHADHVIPYVKTQRTNLFEMKPLCPNCNRKKGAN